MDKLQQQLAQIRARGLSVLNLCQLGPDGIWRANLTDWVSCWEFGEGETPEEALEKALVAPGPKALMRAQAAPPGLATTPDELGL